MKKASLLFLSAVFLFFSCITGNQKATISGDIKNLGNDTIQIILAPFHEKLTYNPTIIITRDGKFSLDTLIDKLHYGMIVSSNMYKNLSDGQKFLIRSMPIDFFIHPNSDVFIQGELDEARTDYRITGDELNEQYLSYKNSVKKYFEESSILSYEVENLYSDGSHDSIITPVYEMSNKNYQLYLSNTLDFIKNNLDYEISAYLLLQKRKSTIIDLYPNLSADVKNSDFGRLIQEKINMWNSISTGSMAPDFEYTTLENKKIKLSDFKGKYVVLDFWGTWCVPCMEEMPRMKEFYDLNKTKVEILGIACNDTEDKWKSTIDENELNWEQILNDKNKHDLAKTYGIEGYPTKVIINPKGVVEGIYEAVKDDFYIKMNELLSHE